MPKPASPPAAPPRRAAFTLIELLVVVAIIAILIAILAPALSLARGRARMAVELSGGRQLIVAYLAYADDYDGHLLPGYLAPFQIRSPSSSAPRLFEYRDPEGRLLHPDTAARYPWRIAPYLDNFDFRGMYFDRALYKEFMAKEDQPALAEPRSRHYALSNNPSFGINSIFVGGHWKRSIPLARRPHIVYLYEVQRPDTLMVFATARSHHVDSPTAVIGPPGGGGGSSPITVAPGCFEVLPPNSYWNQGLYYDSPETAWDQERTPDDFGYLDLRHAGKAITAQFDGHAKLVGLTPGSRLGLRDMRRWANDATSPDWRWDQNQP